MKPAANFEMTRHHTIYPIVAEMTRYDLDELDEQIQLRRIEIAAAALSAQGFSTRTHYNESYFPYLLVGLRDDDQPADEYLEAVWATPADARRLQDFRANLLPQEAFRRWLPHVEPLETEPYTRADADRDGRELNARLKQEVAEGKITGAEYAELVRNGMTSFKDLIS